MNGFKVTYDIVTPESAAEGDYAESGWILDDGDIGLREAIDHWDGIGCHVEADSYPLNGHHLSWLTAYKVNDGTRDYYETGAEESRSLHIPDCVTPASRMRIARLVGAHGSTSAPWTP